MTRTLARLPALLLCGCLVAPSAHALDLARLRLLDGVSSAAQFGFSVAVVGDMDGDGFADYAIGAPSDAAGGPAAGRVFVYRGGPAHAGEAAALVLTGDPGDVLGYSLAAAGDLDGDGYSDLLIGAPAGTSANRQLPGRVLVIHGGPVFGARTPVSVAGPAAGWRFGASLAALGHYQGASDLAIGAPQANADAGLVAIFHGDPTASSVPFAVLHGRQAGDEFGTSVAGAGHTRGTAFADLLVGAPFNSDAMVWAGKAYLYLGGAPADTTPVRGYAGGHAGDFLGQAVAGVGDLDGDGRDDFLAGAPGADVGALTDAGRVYVFRGAATPPAASGLTWSGRHAYDEFGIAIAGIGDVNGDGRPDVGIGAPNAADSLSTGEVQVFLGRAVLFTVADTVFAGESASDMFGRAISNGGRVDAGTRSLFLIGAEQHGVGGRAELLGAAAATLDAGPSHTPTLALEMPRPSPSAGRVRLSFTVPRAAAVRLAIFDAMGRSVAVLANGTWSAGTHEMWWDPRGSAAPPGLYWAVLTGSGERISRRLVFLGP